ncbi:hypothetical protein PS3A_46190 [Pseudomonas sp. 3A(2025)]
MVFVQPATAAQSLAFTLGAPFESTTALPLSDADRQRLSRYTPLRVGIAIADNEPIDITTDGNRYQGVSADYLGLVSLKLDTPVQLVGFAQREDAIEALRDGSIDLLTSANGFDRGEAGLVFSRQYLPDRTVVVAHGKQLVPPQGLAGKKIALLEGYADPQVTHQTYPDSEIILAPTLYSAMEALLQQEVDVFIGNEVVVGSYLAMRPYLDLRVVFEGSLPPTGFAFALRASDQHLRGLVDQALTSLEPALVREVLRRWTLGLNAEVAGQRITLSRAERLWQAKHPLVSVATSEHPPYIYRDKHGHWVGLNVDVLSRISRMTGLQFVYKPVISTQASLDLLRRGQADMNSTLAENAERKQFLNFTYSFGGNHWVFVVRADQASPDSLADLNGRVLALPARHALESEIRRQYPAIQLHLVDTYAQARQLVESGQADVTLQNEAGAWLFAPGKLKVGRSVDGKWSPDRFSVIKSQPELLSILNKALEEFPVAEMRSIRMKWLGAKSPQPSLWSRVPPWVLWSVTLVLLLGLVSLAWHSRLKVQTRLRHNAEVLLNDQLAFRRALLDGIPMPLYVRDLQGRLLSCNRHYETCLGVSIEHLLGRRLIDVDLLPGPLARQAHDDYLQLLESGQPVFAERVLEYAGHPIEVSQWSVPFFSAEGQLQGLLGGWVDNTGHKRLQERLNQAEAAHATLVSDMNHQLSARLEAIIDLLELEFEQDRRQGKVPSEALQAWMAGR